MTGSPGAPQHQKGAGATKRHRVQPAAESQPSVEGKRESVRKTEACASRDAHVRVCTHTHTHTVIHSQPETQMWNQTDPVNHSALVPRAREEDRRERQVARNRPSHLVALGPHTHRDTNVEARRRWPQSCEGATPCASGLVSEPSSRGQVCECESVCVCVCVCARARALKGPKQSPFNPP